MAAYSLDVLSPPQAAERLRSLYELLRRKDLPHEEDKEAELYPAVHPAQGGTDPPEPDEIETADLRSLVGRRPIQLPDAIAGSLIRRVARSTASPPGSTTISVSNRQKATVLHYGAALAGQFDFLMTLALADFKGARGQLVAARA